jgi:hypothetical protein
VNRLVLAELAAWLDAEGRRPLVLRGARQVGKTWLVRGLAEKAGLRLIELNFEREPRQARLFASNDPRQVLGEISLHLQAPIEVDRSLLFLDEVQAAPEVLAKLRWFAEELPALPVVAAGSLLEQALSEHAFSMPVGRIGFRHVEPMSFPEFLEAHDQTVLLRALRAWRPGAELSPEAHAQASRCFHEYAMVGGLPAVVAKHVERRDPRACRALQRDLVATYRADFAKYAGRMDRNVIDAILLAIARGLGHKFVYARADEGVKQHQAKRALELISRARLCTLVRHTDANGLPLGGEVKDSSRKAILLDVGLLHALLGTPAQAAFPAWDDLSSGVRGQVMKQIVGQQIRLLGEGDGDGTELYFWHREGGRPGEVDYVLQLHGRVVPVEVKSGVAGAMKSLHQFVHDKGLSLAVRVDSNPPSSVDLAVRTTQGDDVRYRLLSLPAYLVWALERALA